MFAYTMLDTVRKKSFWPLLSGNLTSLFKFSSLHQLTLHNFCVMFPPYSVAALPYTVHNHTLSTQFSTPSTPCSNSSLFSFSFNFYWKLSFTFSFLNFSVGLKNKMLSYRLLLISRVSTCGSPEATDRGGAPSLSVQNPEYRKIKSFWYNFYYVSIFYKQKYEIKLSKYPKVCLMILKSIIW